MTIRRYLSSRDFGWYLTLILSVITLPGVVDGLVKWKEWFEVGWMEHWRVLREWLLLNLFWWVPFHLPDGYFEYFVIGAVFFRALFALQLSEPLSDLPQNFLLSVIMGLLWPMSVSFVLVLSLLMGRDRDVDAVIAFGVSLLVGAVIVFVASDALQRLL